MLRASIDGAPRPETGEKPVKQLIACIVLIAPLAAHAQLMKCVGSDGRVEYAAECPPGTKGQSTGIQSTREGPSSSGAPATKQKSLAESEVDFRKRQTEGAEAQKKAEAKAAEVAQRREACDRAQTYLRSLQEGQRISRIDPKTGERVFLEDADRAAEVTRARNVADANCK
jgi:hypothetical protein